MLVSQADYARQHGVARKTVTVWKRAGRLRLRGGKVDVEASDAKLADAGLGLFAGLAPGEVTAPPQSGAAAPRRFRPAAIERLDPDAALDDPESLEAFLDGLIGGEYASQAAAERIKENALAAKRVLEFQQAAGSLVELETAEAAFFEQARADRDAWQNWPSRIGPLLAAEFGIPADKFTEALARHVHDELSRRGEPDPEFSVGES